MTTTPEQPEPHPDSIVESTTPTSVVADLSRIIQTVFDDLDIAHEAGRTVVNWVLVAETATPPEGVMTSMSVIPCPTASAPTIIGLLTLASDMARDSNRDVRHGPPPEPEAG